MIPVGAIILATIPTGLIVYLQFMRLYSRQTRNLLRPQIERLIIEKRWIERAASSQRQFEAEWQWELRELYFDCVPALARRLFRIEDFELALNAEFACLTNQEIASWTFADRVSASHGTFERVIVRCLERLDWAVTQDRRVRGIGADLLLRHGKRRVALRCHYGRHEVECRGVMEVAHAAWTAGCEAACIVTNGRFNGATRTLAEQVGVILLHCSQLDMLADAAAGTPVAAPTWIEDERLAA